MKKGRARSSGGDEKMKVATQATAETEEQEKIDSYLALSIIHLTRLKPSAATEVDGRVDVFTCMRRQLRSSINNNTQRQNLRFKFLT